MQYTGEGADSDEGEGEGEDLLQAAEDAGSQNLLTLDQAIPQSDLIKVASKSIYCRWLNQAPASTMAPLHLESLPPVNMSMALNHVTSCVDWKLLLEAAA